MASNDFIYVLPSLGADMDEAALLEWKIKPGDRVKRGQVVATLETVKAAIDAEIWVDGVVEELLVQPDKDRKIKVGAPLARLKTDKPMEQPAVVVVASPSPPPSAPPLPLLKEREGRLGGVGEARPQISPAARRFMQELGVAESDLAAIDHPYGIADIEQFAASRQSSGPKTMREQIAKAMSRSKREIPEHEWLLREQCVPNQ